MKRLLVQTQLSNYDARGTWILECDSGWQMAVGRVREMLRLRSDILVTVTGPERSALRTQPEDVTPDVMLSPRVTYAELRLMPNALATRFDFDIRAVAAAVGLPAQRSGAEQPYDSVYVNDPMHLRNFAAMFHLFGARRPRFVVHSHFIDNPECPKFPTDASLWHGQVEAAIRADWNFWQCASALNVFLSSATKLITKQHVSAIMRKSEPWDDGYSRSEMLAPVDMKNVRFDPARLDAMRSDSVVVFVPNRVGGRGRSSDYTNCGKFLFDILPRARAISSVKLRVIAGNPSQKFSNSELVRECGVEDLTPDSLTRDEMKLVMSRAHIAVGLYDQDAYGGTAAREAIELGCVPLWINNYEYARLAASAGWRHVARADMADLPEHLAQLARDVSVGDPAVSAQRERLAAVVARECSFESTTAAALPKLFGEQ